MNQQENAGAYRAAIETAMDELNFICQELERLRNRQYQFERVAEVLKPLIGSGEQMVEQDPAEIALPQLVPQKMSDPVSSRSTCVRNGLPGPIRCSCPTYSSSVRGRMRSASGRVVSVAPLAFGMGWNKLIKHCAPGAHSA